MGKKRTSFSRKASEAVDGIVEVFSPRAACRRKAYRFAYDAIDNTRTRKKRSDLGGSGDKQLTEMKLYRLRGICRDLCRNNPLAKGLLKLERNGIVGSGAKIQARTGDDNLNADIEAAWAEEMLQRPCDVTGKFTFNQLLRLTYLSYRRDGDVFILLTKNGPQIIEGEQVGTPWSGSIVKEAKNFDIVNGVAISKKTKKIIGYYIGASDQFGYIKQDSYKSYKTEYVQHMFDPERASQSRGEPILTPSIDYIDKLCDYIDAELVAAKVNACFSMFIAAEEYNTPAGFTEGISSTGEDEHGNRLEKMEPGTIMYGKSGEKAYGIGQVRPGALFDPFVTKMLMLIGRPLCMPLMLVSLDFSGATFMNARIAYQKAQEGWEAQQDNVVKPLVSRIWRWKLQQLIDAKQFKYTDGIFRHEIFCKRWPYIDPWREAKADEQQLKNRTTTRTAICARQGDDFEEVVTRRASEEERLEKSSIAPDENEK